MIPYIEAPVFVARPFVFQSFQVLLVLAILTGYFTMVRRARRAGLDPARAAELCVWALVPGLLVAHWFKLFYRQQSFDLLDLLRIMNGISSFGGIAGGLAGAAIFFWRRRMKAAERWRYLDILAYSFLCGMVFGRIGCFLAHDHPGVRTASWLAVRYPDGPRYDLALLELIALPFFLWMFRLLGREGWPAGFYTGCVLVLYAAFRMGLDTLHEAPPAYWGVPVDQLASAACLASGLIILHGLRDKLYKPLDRKQHS